MYESMGRAKTVGDLCKLIIVILITAAVFSGVYAVLRHRNQPEPEVTVEVLGWDGAWQMVPTTTTVVTATFDEDLHMLAMAVHQKEGWLGDPHPGPNGEMGPLQITPICLKDYVEHHDGETPDCWKWPGSYKVFEWYMTHYGVDRGLPFEQFPRLWNGGPDGHTEPNTVEYSRDVINYYVDVLVGFEE